MTFAVACIASFFFGAVPFGYIVGRLKGVDVRKHGSGNIGATNVSRVLGKGYGALVLFLDAFKGFLPVLAVKGYPLTAQLGVAMFAVLGHCFSPFLLLKGGKGVATAFGAFLCASPKVTAIAVLIFFLVFLTTRYVSLSSMVTASSFPVVFSAVEGFSPTAFAILLFTATVIVGKHYQNILRLLKGEERKFK